MQQITAASSYEKNRCAGCREPIKDRFIFSVIDLNWHQDCVQCSDCSLKLIDQCYEIEGKLYCKLDYWRRFGPKCFACCKSIEKGELVQKLVEGNRVYHLKCFTCNKCHKIMKAGEQLHLIGGKKILCKQDFNQLQNAAANSQSNSANSNNSLSPSTPNATTNISRTTINHHNLQFDPQASDSSDGGDGSCVNLDSELNDKSVELMGDDRDDELLDDRDEGGANGLDDGGDDLNSNEKRRGPRTTIKPKQLEVLRQAFESAPKPSRHIREKLAEETGLNMRVIQVWFQNRRSKERRMKNSNGSARRNFFRSSSRRLRVAGPTSATAVGAASAGTTPTQQNGGPQQQQSLIASGARPANSGGGTTAKPQKSGHQRPAAQLSPLVEAASLQQQPPQVGGRGKPHESPSEFGGSSSGGFTYFSDSSNQGDSAFAMGANASQPPSANANQSAGAQYLANGQSQDSGAGGHTLLTLGSPPGGQPNGNHSKQYLGSPHAPMKHTPPPSLMAPGVQNPQAGHHLMLGGGHPHSQSSLMQQQPPPQLHSMGSLGGQHHPMQQHLGGGPAGSQLLQPNGGMSMGPTLVGHPPVVQW